MAGSLKQNVMHSDKYALDIEINFLSRLHSGGGGSDRKEWDARRVFRDWNHSLEIHGMGRAVCHALRVPSCRLLRQSSSQVVVEP